MIEAMRESRVLVARRADYAKLMRDLEIFLSQRQWVKLQAKFRNTWDELSGVNRKEPNGLLKIA